VGQARFAWARKTRAPLTLVVDLLNATGLNEFMSVNLKVSLIIALLILSGCTWQKTRNLHHESYRGDTRIESYVSACLLENVIYVKYIPSPTTVKYKGVLSEYYWAKTTIEITKNSPTTFPQWEIYRTSQQPRFNKDTCANITIINIEQYLESPVRKFKHRDDYIAWIVDSNNYTLPVILVDYSDGNNYRNDYFSLLTYKTHNRYRGLGNEPSGSYRDGSIIFKNSWKYPFYVIGDFLLQPIYWLFGGWS